MSFPRLCTRRVTGCHGESFSEIYPSHHRHLSSLFTKIRRLQFESAGSFSTTTCVGARSFPLSRRPAGRRPRTMQESAHRPSGRRWGTNPADSGRPCYGALPECAPSTRPATESVGIGRSSPSAKRYRPVHVGVAGARGIRSALLQNFAVRWCLLGKTGRLAGLETKLQNRLRIGLYMVDQGAGT